MDQYQDDQQRVFAIDFNSESSDFLHQAIRVINEEVAFAIAAMESRGEFDEKA